MKSKSKKSKSRKKEPSLEEFLFTTHPIIHALQALDIAESIIQDGMGECPILISQAKERLKSLLKCEDCNRKENNHEHP